MQLRKVRAVNVHRPVDRNNLSPTLERRGGRFREIRWRKLCVYKDRYITILLPKNISFTLSSYFRNKNRRSGIIRGVRIVSGFAFKLEILNAFQKKKIFIQLRLQALSSSTKKIIKTIFLYFTTLNEPLKILSQQSNLLNLYENSKTHTQLCTHTHFPLPSLSSHSFVNCDAT